MAIVSPIERITGYVVTASDYNTLIRNWLALIDSPAVDLPLDLARAPVTGVQAAKTTIESTTAAPVKPDYVAYLFDPAATEVLVWDLVLPRGYGFNPQVELLYYMVSNNVAKSVKVNVHLWAVSGSDPGVDSGEYDAVNSAVVPAPDTSKQLASQLVTLTNIDGMVAGDRVTLRLEREGGDVGDDAAGDLVLLGARLNWDLAN